MHFFKWRCIFGTSWRLSFLRGRLAIISGRSGVGSDQDINIPMGSCNVVVFMSLEKSKKYLCDSSAIVHIKQQFLNLDLEVLMFRLIYPGIFFKRIRHAVSLDLNRTLFLKIESRVSSRALTLERPLLNFQWNVQLGTNNHYQRSVMEREVSHTSSTLSLRTMWKEFEDECTD